jgi:hypothetical protein
MCHSKAVSAQGRSRYTYCSNSPSNPGGVISFDGSSSSDSHQQSSASTRCSSCTRATRRYGRHYGQRICSYCKYPATTELNEHDTLPDAPELTTLAPSHNNIFQGMSTSRSIQAANAPSVLTSSPAFAPEVDMIDSQGKATVSQIPSLAPISKKSPFLFGSIMNTISSPRPAQPQSQLQLGRGSDGQAKSSSASLATSSSRLLSAMKPPNSSLVPHIARKIDGEQQRTATGCAFEAPPQRLSTTTYSGPLHYNNLHADDQMAMKLLFEEVITKAVKPITSKMYIIEAKDYVKAIIAICENACNGYMQRFEAKMRFFLGKVEQGDSREWEEAAYAALRTIYAQGIKPREANPTHPHYQARKANLGTLVTWVCNTNKTLAKLGTSSLTWSELMEMAMCREEEVYRTQPWARYAVGIRKAVEDFAKQSFVQQHERDLRALSAPLAPFHRVQKRGAKGGASGEEVAPKRRRDSGAAD